MPFFRRKKKTWDAIDFDDEVTRWKESELEQGVPVQKSFWDEEARLPAPPPRSPPKVKEVKPPAAEPDRPKYPDYVLWRCLPKIHDPWAESSDESSRSVSSCGSSLVMVSHADCAGAPESFSPPPARKTKRARFRAVVQRLISRKRRNRATQVGKFD